MLQLPNELGQLKTAKQEQHSLIISAKIKSPYGERDLFERIDFFAKRNN